MTDKSLLTSGSNNVYVDEKTGKLSFADNVEKDAKVSVTYKENFLPLVSKRSIPKEKRSTKPLRSMEQPL